MLTERDPTEVTQARAATPPAAPLDLVAVVTSRKSAVISAQVAARIEKLAIRSGQMVKAGQLIARLDKTELESKLLQAESNEKSAQLEAGAYGAQASALRQKMIAETRLNKLGVTPPIAVITARAEYAQIGSTGGAALARALTAKAAREQAETDLERAEIVAPLTGVITNIKAREGEVAQIGTPLARVFDPSDLIIRFAVPRDHAAAVALGQRVELTIDGDSRRAFATVTSVSGAQEPPINFTVVEADIDDTKLAPGQLAVAAVGHVRIADARGARP
jgi:membrane fusion protein (multidrug efflux system)